MCITWIHSKFGRDMSPDDNERQEKSIKMYPRERFPRRQSSSSFYLINFLRLNFLQLLLHFAAWCSIVAKILVKADIELQNESITEAPRDASRFITHVMRNFKPLQHPNERNLLQPAAFWHVKIFSREYSLNVVIISNTAHCFIIKWQKQSNCSFRTRWKRFVTDYNFHELSIHCHF